MKSRIYGFITALAIMIAGIALAFYGNILGVGLIIGGIAAAVVNILFVLKQAEDRIKKLEEEIEFLKNN